MKGKPAGGPDKAKGRVDGRSGVAGRVGGGVAVVLAAGMVVGWAVTGAAVAWAEWGSGGAGRVAAGETKGVGGGVAAAVPADPQVHLERILRGGLYQRWRLRQGGAEERGGWLRAYVRAVQQMVEDVLAWLRGRQEQVDFSPSSGVMTFSTERLLEVVFWVAVVVGGGFVLYVLVRVVRGGGWAGEGARVLSRREVDRALEQGRALAMPAERWLDESGRLAEQQDLRRAFRALYLALLAGLHVRGRIDYRRNRTNWVYVRQFRGPRGLGQMFERLTGLFDEIWYGQRMPGRVVLSEARRSVERLLAEGGDDER